MTGMTTFGRAAIFTISASQIESWRLCARRWAFRAIDRAKYVPNAAAQLGTQAHKYREAWLTKGIAIPDDKAGKLARVGVEHLPPIGLPDVELQIDLNYPLTADKFVGIAGKVDFFVPNQEPSKLWGTPYVPLVGDHKTSSTKAWAKTPEILLNGDPQAAIYSAYAIARYPNTEFVDLHWSYMIKSSTPQPHQVRARMSRHQVADSLGLVLDDARKMLPIIETTGIRAKDLEPTTKSCQAMNGCPYISICPLKPIQIMGSIMAQGDLNELLKAKYKDQTPDTGELTFMNLGAQLVAKNKELSPTANPAVADAYSMFSQQPALASQFVEAYEAHKKGEKTMFGNFFGGGTNGKGAEPQTPAPGFMPPQAPQAPAPSFMQQQAPAPSFMQQQAPQAPQAQQLPFMQQQAPQQAPAPSFMQQAPQAPQQQQQQYAPAPQQQQYAQAPQAPQAPAPSFMQQQAPQQQYAQAPQAPQAPQQQYANAVNPPDAPPADLAAEAAPRGRGRPRKPTAEAAAAATAPTANTFAGPDVGASLHRIANALDFIVARMGNGNG